MDPLIDFIDFRMDSASVITFGVIKAKLVTVRLPREDFQFLVLVAAVIASPLQDLVGTFDV